MNTQGARRGLRAHWPWALLAGALLFAVVLVTVAWTASEGPSDDPSALRVPPGGHRLAETFTLAGFEYRVTYARAFRRVASVQSAPGTYFVVVRYTETNRGSSTHIGVGDNCTVRDANGRVYHSSARAEAAASAALGVPAAMVVELHANVPREALAAFEVARDSLAQPVDIDFEERGFFNSGHTSVRALVPPPPPWADSVPLTPPRP